MAEQKLRLDEAVDVLKAAGEPTRLRLLLLLAGGDLTVTDLTEILGQSQPRISRHLKLLGEAGLIDRYQEGAWAYFRLRGQGESIALVRAILGAADGGDPVLERDSARLKALKQTRSERAQDYFARNAAEWDALRRLHVGEQEVEDALLDALGRTPVSRLLDLGTGTGRMLQLLDGLYEEATGVDASRDMLAVARANLDRAGVSRAAVRLGDIFNLPLEAESFDLVTIHQVLHFLQEPEAAVQEAARLLADGGRLAIVDLAPHAVEDLRDEHAHLRLGFSHAQMLSWLEQSGLSLTRVVDLTPSTAANRPLTVTIWIATKGVAHVSPPVDVGQAAQPLAAGAR
ncbi:ArsR/SmtB family transcription factor [Rhizobium sp. YIM 134829]|uniref:ArsR/SmtB family transcription factor n=1 Tax=Rhizobium sp. YIM 134829 TaxID=3390453 RepID=UPI00397BB714